MGRSIGLLMAAAVSVFGMTDAAGSVVGAPTRSVQVASEPPDPWLDHLNHLRARVDLPLLVENEDWSAGAVAHSRYMVLTGDIGHDQDAGSPGASPAGAAAAAAGLVAATSELVSDTEAIDLLTSGPLHVLAVLDPRLTTVGFGRYSDPGATGFRTGTTLDVVRGLDTALPWLDRPLVWPSSGLSVPSGSFDIEEFPDPLADCGPGWGRPTGLPVVALFPRAVTTALVEVAEGDVADTCVLTAQTASDPLTAALLSERRAVVVIPRDPIPEGERIALTITATDEVGSTMVGHTWFTVGGVSLAGRPVWAELRPGGDGSWLATDRGEVVPSPGTPDHGGVSHLRLNGPVIALQSTPTGDGYWLVAADGGVFALGDARFYGSAGDSALTGATVALESTSSGSGYWITTTAGQVVAYGDAGHHGDVDHLVLAAPVVDIARTPSGRGYWLVAADGGVFAFGDASFHGSAGAIALAEPVVGMAPTPTGDGYWLLATDGGVFSYGAAPFHGSAGAIELDSSARAIASTATGDGYWILTDHGQIVPFGGAAGQPD